MGNKDRILKYLEEHGTITTLESFNKLGITDPQHYIMQLRNEGYNITDEWIHGTNRVGQRVKFKRYRLEKEDGK